MYTIYTAYAHAGWLSVSTILWYDLSTMSFFKIYIALVTMALSWLTEERRGEGNIRQLPADL